MHCASPRLTCSGRPLMVRVQVALSRLRSPTGLLYHQQLCCNARIMALMGRSPGVELVWDWIEWIKPYLPYLAYFTLFLHFLLHLLPSYLAYTLNVGLVCRRGWSFTKAKQRTANSSALQLYIIDVTSKAATTRAAITTLVTVTAACLEETWEAGSKEGKDGEKLFSKPWPDSVYIFFQTVWRQWTAKTWTLIDGAGFSLHNGPRHFVLLLEQQGSTLSKTATWRPLPDYLDSLTTRLSKKTLWDP